jgi:hypothetical protein
MEDEKDGLILLALELVLDVGLRLPCITQLYVRIIISTYTYINI